MRTNLVPRVRQLLREHSDGLTMPEIMQMTSASDKGLRTALKNMPDTYIDRWIKSGKNGSYFPVWCVVVPPADCPKPRQERPYIASRGLQALSFHH